MTATKTTTVTTTAAAAMAIEDVIYKDVQRLIREHPEWSFRLALSILAIRYTSADYRLKACEMVESIIQS
jgi:hypothetical protein